MRHTQSKHLIPPEVTWHKDNHISCYFNQHSFRVRCQGSRRERNRHVDGKVSSYWSFQGFGRRHTPERLSLSVQSWLKSLTGRRSTTILTIDHYRLHKLRNPRKILIRKTSNSAETNITVEQVPHLLPTSRVLCSNLGQDNGYTGVFSFSHSVSDLNSGVNTSNLTAPATPLPSTSLPSQHPFTSITTIRGHEIWVTDTVLNKDNINKQPDEWKTTHAHKTLQYIFQQRYPSRIPVNCLMSLIVCVSFQHRLSLSTPKSRAPTLLNLLNVCRGPF